mgnify:CR=1 FL=1
MTSILYPWKTTASIIKNTADSVVGNKDNKGKGKIVIPFKSDDELERIIAIFDKLNT